MGGVSSTCMTDYQCVTSLCSVDDRVYGTVCQKDKVYGLLNLKCMILIALITVD